MQIIDEPISVIASFNPSLSSKIKPVKFLWGKRAFEIKEITYQWKTKEGRTVIHHFSATDGRTLYEISFNSDTLMWKLEALETG